MRKSALDLPYISLLEKCGNSLSRIYWFRNQFRRMNLVRMKSRSGDVR